MLHPESLPRASTQAMTTEYSFMRTTVPRGPKLGSLGIPPARERKPRTAHSSKIHSLADYKSPEDGGGGGGGGSGGAGESARTADGSLHSTMSSVSTLSELSSVSDSPSVEGQPGSLLQPADGTFECDGSESGARPGTDGNDSDSSTYSSVSARGVYATLAAAVGERYRAPYTVQGREIAAEAVGQFPSLQEVLQAASDEQQQLLELEQEREGPAEPRSRRDSFSSRYPHAQSDPFTPAGGHSVCSAQISGLTLV